VAAPGGFPFRAILGSDWSCGWLDLWNDVGVGAHQIATSSGRRAHRRMFVGALEAIARDRR
jgi:hypothetical protein